MSHRELPSRRRRLPPRPPLQPPRSRHSASAGAPHQNRAKSQAQPGIERYDFSMSSHRLMSAAVVLAATVSWGGRAHADMSRTVIAAFKGELVITKADLPEGKSEKD